MRRARIKVDSEMGQAVYHCMTRTVNGEKVIDDPAKEVLRRQLWQIADFCGVQIITYAIMPNHFHVLLRVPRKSAVSDQELLRRYQVLYPKPTKYQTAHLKVIKSQLVEKVPEADAWRARQLALMGDVSQFMKLVKQRFSVWFNRTHNRYGTLWAERFKSVLVEGKAGTLRTMAAYIDLNAVRAGFVNDPKDYRFCGYGEAVAGQKPAREGLRHVVHGPTPNWRTVQSSYRQTLFGKGCAPKAQGEGHRIDPDAFDRVVKNQGHLALADVLRTRVRFFTDGAVLGSQRFVQEHVQHYHRTTRRRGCTRPRPLPPITNWGDDLNTLRGLRKQAFG